MFEGRVESTIYDTSYLARLSGTHPQFRSALTHIRETQFPDGSWGSNYFHGHDRFVNTLSAIIALREQGNSSDALQIAHGEQFLSTLDVTSDAHDTIGFPLIAAALCDHARRLGLRLPAVQREELLIKQKIELLGKTPASWRKASSVFSLEALLELTPIPSDLNPYDLYNGYGCVAASPAATAALLAHCPDEAALNWLQYYQNPDGGIGDVNPIDCFEMAWIAEYGRQAGKPSPDWLDDLYAFWSDEYGLLSSSNYEIYDLDATASGFLSLYAAGYPVATTAFKRHLAGDHYLCFIGEANSSLSMHARVAAALTAAGDIEGAEIARQVLLMAYHKNELWFDKWHVSPFYLRTLALQSISDSQIEAEIGDWLLTTQRPDGGWGWQFSTPEETAYALFGLYGEHRLSADVAGRAAGYLQEHRHELTPLWIGKGLYTSRFLIQSIVLLAEDVCEICYSY